MPVVPYLAEQPDVRGAPMPQRSASGTSCRLCGDRLPTDLIDLGCLPLAGHTVPPDLTDNEPTYRLRVRICDSCRLVQIAEPVPPRPSSDAMLPEPPGQEEHARRLAAALIQKWRLDADSQVVQIGSGGGTLLRHLEAAGVRAQGIALSTTPGDTSVEIAAFTAEAAMDIAVRIGRADLVILDGVLPKVADLFDFAAGLASIIRPNGVISMTVPHVLPLLQHLQFDAFRHDIRAYLSLRVLERLLCSVGLRVFDAERLTEDGGTLRVHACLTAARFAARPGLKTVRTAETMAESDIPGLYAGFSARVASAREHIREFIAIRQAAGRYVTAFGATSRGSMLLNACGLTSRDVACVADVEPAPFGRRLPGSQVPIVPLQMLRDDPPDDVLILPWPYAHEIAASLSALRQKGAQCWTLLPRIARV